MQYISENAYKNKVKYNNQYNKEHYIKKGITLRPEENDLINKVLLGRGVTLREYILLKVEEDIKQLTNGEQK